MDKEFHFPYSICDLIFDIARGATDSMPNEYWAIPEAMTNNKSQLEYGNALAIGSVE
jgi:hypothetical protein